FTTSYPDVSFFALRDVDGNTVVRTDGAPGEPTDGPTVVDEARRGTIPLADPLDAGGRRRPVIALGAPIRDPEGRFAGQAVTTLASTRLARILARASVVASGEAYMVDAEGRVIAHQDAALVSDLADFAAAPAVAAARANPSGQGALSYRAADGDRLTGYARVPEVGWHVVVEQPATTALAGARAGRQLAFDLLLVVIVMASLPGALAPRWPAGPLGAPPPR